MCGYWYTFGPFGFILWILFWAIILMIVFRLLRGTGWYEMKRSDELNHKRSLDILEERYAKGEIDKKEFEDKRRDLRS